MRSSNAARTAANIPVVILTLLSSVVGGSVQAGVGSRAVASRRAPTDPSGSQACICGPTSARFLRAHYAAVLEVNLDGPCPNNASRSAPQQALAPDYDHLQMLELYRYLPRVT